MKNFSAETQRVAFEGLYRPTSSGGGGNIQLTGDTIGGPGPSPIDTTTQSLQDGTIDIAPLTGAMAWDVTAAPHLGQDPAAGVNGAPFQFGAQSVSSGNGNGGDLDLASGSGFGTGVSGNVNLVFGGLGG